MIRKVGHLLLGVVMVALLPLWVVLAFLQFTGMCLSYIGEDAAASFREWRGPR